MAIDPRYMYELAIVAPLEDRQICVDFPKSPTHVEPNLEMPSARAGTEDSRISESTLAVVILRKLFPPS